MSHVAVSLTDALEYLAAHPGLPLYGGGTDLMVDAPDEAEYLFLHQVEALGQITADGEHLRIGAGCTFSEVEESPLCPELLRAAIRELAAPAIRNLGTIGGNVGNGSAKADTALIFFVADAALRILSLRGERIVPIAAFYRGPKALDLAPDELIAEILLPQKWLGSWYYQKVGARNALAISRVAFAGLADTAGGRVNHLATAFGAVTPVILRRAELDAMLVGKSLAEARALKPRYLAAWEEAITPTQGRISARYRKDVCRNLLLDFLDRFGL